MRTPVPPPCPPRAKIATTAGETLATTATRSASDLRTSFTCAGAEITSAKRTARPRTRLRRMIILPLRSPQAHGWQSVGPAGRRRSHGLPSVGLEALLLTHPRIRQRQMIVQIQKVSRADDELPGLHVAAAEADPQGALAGDRP